MRLNRTFTGLAAAAVAASVMSCGDRSGSGRSRPAPPPAAHRHSTAPTTPASSTPPPPPTRAELRATARRTVERIERHQPPGAVSVAALNTVTGERFVAGRDHGMWTASTYKVFVLAALLLRTGGDLSGSEQADATAAIERSDNAAGYRLFLDAGGNAGLEEAAERLHMPHTVPGRSDPTFTTTGAPDYLNLLGDLIHKSALSPRSRAYILGLMRNVEADQRWGVGSVADKGTSFANKNGWLGVDDSNGPGEEDDGRWVASSVGIVHIKGQRVLMAIFTEHQPSFDAGVRLVEKLAHAIAPAVARR